MRRLIHRFLGFPPGFRWFHTGSTPRRPSRRGPRTGGVKPRRSVDDRATVDALRDRRTEGQRGDPERRRQKVPRLDEVPGPVALIVRRDRPTRRGGTVTRELV